MMLNQMVADGVIVPFDEVRSCAEGRAYRNIQYARPDEYDSKAVGCRCWKVGRQFCADCLLHAAQSLEVLDRQSSEFCHRTLRWSDDDFERYEEVLSNTLAKEAEKKVLEQGGFISHITKACGASKRDRRPEREGQEVADERRVGRRTDQVRKG